MKTRLALLALAAGLLVSFALPRVGGAPASQGGQGRGPDTELGKFMSDMSGTLKEVGTALAEEGDLKQALAEVCRLQKGAIDAKGEVPVQVAEMQQGKKQDKALIEFRESMHGLLGGLFQLELALVAEDAKAAGKALRELDKVKSAGHGKFKGGGW
jgi:hypothetical protein